MKLRNLITILTIGLTSCYSKPLNDHVDRKSKHEITIGDVRMAARLLKDQAQKDSTSDTSHELVWFNMNIEKANAELEKQKLLYVNFDMQQDFTLVANGDSLASVFCQRIENGNPSSFEYAVAFEQPSLGIQDNYTLLYKDKIFGIGSVAFVYNQNDIKK